LVFTPEWARVARRYKDLIDWVDGDGTPTGNVGATE
jgi:hypothetical protein